METCHDKVVTRVPATPHSVRVLACSVWYVDMKRRIPMWRCNELMNLAGRAGIRHWDCDEGILGASFYGRAYE